MRVSNYLVGKVVSLLFLGQTFLQAQPWNEEQAKLPPSVTNSIYYQRWLWDRQDRVLPDGHVPHRGRELALERIRKLKGQAGIPTEPRQRFPQPEPRALLSAGRSASAVEITTGDSRDGSNRAGQNRNRPMDRKMDHNNRVVGSNKALGMDIPE